MHSGDPLTDRELQILALVAEGESTRAIRTRLGISENTIKSHLTRIYRKTGSRNRVQAVRHYLDRHGTPQPHDDPRPSSSKPAHLLEDPGQPSLIQRQMREIEARLDELAAATMEAERLRDALTALRAIEPEGPRAS